MGLFRNGRYEGYKLSYSKRNTILGESQGWETEKEKNAKFEEEYAKAAEAYKENPNLLIDDIDSTIIQVMIGVLINFDLHGIIRDDLIDGIDAIFRCRGVVVEKECNNSGNKN